jgi:hypothetical protein
MILKLCEIHRGLMGAAKSKIMLRVLKRAITNILVRDGLGIQRNAQILIVIHKSIFDLTFPLSAYIPLE